MRSTPSKPKSPERKECTMRQLSCAAIAASILSGLASAQEAKLVASDAAPYDHFGSATAVLDDMAAVGAPQINQPGGLSAGSVYVFVRDGMTWSQQAELTASDAALGGAFGSSVALTNDTLIVGATENNPGGDGVGSAYVFVRSEEGWIEQAKLTASGVSTAHWFGNSVAISGDTAVVGALADGGLTTNQTGAAYVFVRSGTSWTQQARLVASDAENEDRFGTSLAISGDTVVIGSPQDDGPGGLSTGSAYIFVRNGTTWTEAAKLTAPESQGGAEFGSSVSMSGNTLIAGASRENVGAETQAGSAYVFVGSGASWTQQARLTASDATHADFFGYAVALSGEMAVLGAVGDDDAGLSSGAAYVFARTGSSWAERAKLKASDGAADEYFGLAVALSNDAAIVGAPAGDNAGGVNAGSAYAYSLSVGPWKDLGFGLAGVSGVPELTGTGTLIAGSTGALELTSAAPSAPALLFASLTSTPTPFKCGTLLPVPVAFKISSVTSPGGGIVLGWPSWPAGLSGQMLTFQHAVLDAAAPCGVALSNALQGNVP
jgi:hypothetical protein